MAGATLSNGGGARPHRMITEINVTPFVDIVLVLLIIFMVTTSYIVRDSLSVTLPEAATGDPQKVSLIALTLDKEGILSLNGETVEEGKLRDHLREQIKNGSVPEAVIAADKNVPHGKVVSLIDLVRSEGVRKFAINVLKPSS